MKEIRIGFIGTGGRGAYLSQFAHMPEKGCRVVAGCDISPAAIAEFKQRYGETAFVTEDFRALVVRPDVDAVFITTPDFTHEEQAVAALDAGKAVYCEKPLAISIEGADRILDAARRNKQRLFVGHNMRYMGFVRAMKEMVDSGVIGDIKSVWCRHFISYGGDAYFKDWHSERRNTTGLLLQKAVHDIDVIHWICGAYTERVCGMGSLSVYGDCKRRKHDTPGDASWHLENWPPLSQKNLSPVIDVEDLSMINMRLANGVLAAYQQCHFTPDAWRNYTFIGTRGRIENIGDFTGDCIIRVWEQRTQYREHGDREVMVAAGDGFHGGADQIIVREFLDFVRHGGIPAASPVAARYSVAAAFQATQSIRNAGMPFDVPVLDDAIVKYFEASWLDRFTSRAGGFFL